MDTSHTVALSATVSKREDGWIVQFEKTTYGPIETEQQAIELAQSVIELAFRLAMGLLHDQLTVSLP